MSDTYPPHNHMHDIFVPGELYEIVERTIFPAFDGGEPVKLYEGDRFIFTEYITTDTDHVGVGFFGTHIFYMVPADWISERIRLVSII